MSVLSFPRVYFKGFVEWDPCTFNNNDWQQFPTYDGANAALNWPYLAGQGITQDNFPQAFRPWAITLQEDTLDSPSGKRIPAEWNMFGTHGVSFVQHGRAQTTTVTGGALSPSKPVTSDPLIGGAVSVSGDGGRGPGRLVDSNPASFWSSQVFWGKFAFGNSGAGLTGPMNFRMHSRFLNLNRIYSSTKVMTAPAAGVACCLQTCIPTDQITWKNNAYSPLVTALQNAAAAPGAKGIMIRVTAYVNLYFVNGILNDIPARPRNYTDLAGILAKAWDAWNKNGDTSQFFSNPAYSHAVGVVGVWHDGELASVPGGRYLVAENPVAGNVPPDDGASAVAARQLPASSGGHGGPGKLAAAAAPPPTFLGPAVVQVDHKAKVISLDLSSTFPENGTPGEWPSDLEKADFGPLTVGVVSGGTFTPIATLDYAQYGRASYEARAGIVDIPFPDSGTGALLKSGTLAFQLQGQTALLEQPLVAQTDRRAIYVNQKGEAQFDVTVFAGGVRSPNANILVAQYDNGLNLVPSNLTEFVRFTNGTRATVITGGISTNVTTVRANEKGVATVSIAAASPGFPILVFIPYTGTTAPPPPTNVAPGPPWNNSICFTYYTTVRVLPFDDAVPGKFVELWNATHDSTQAWNYVYTQVLYLYDQLFNVMLKHVNLGSQSAVEANLKAIWSMISEAAFAESTYAMPITRDLSAGKRLTLQLWIYLAANKYQVPELAEDSIPKGWKP